jgi:glycosyltransferase involved in cell wall biosynthesis
MNVAWVTPYLPEPATSGGAIRQQRLAAALAAHADIHLFARGEPWERRRLRSRELGIFASTWLGRDYWPSRRPTDSTRIRRGSPASLYRAVAALHRKIRLDLVVVAHSWGSLGAPELGVPWLLDEHNVESRYFEDLYRSEHRAGERVERELREIARWERHVWTSATALTCVSDADAALIAEHRAKSRRHGAANAASENDVSLVAPLVVPNGADVSTVEPAPRRERRGGILFVGSMHHRPNVDAALRLAGSILPRVWAEEPRASLTVVGGPVPPELALSRERLDTAHASLVRVLGRVPDVRPHLADALIYANPLRHGAGSSLKIAEALGAGIPIVSSELGVRGFDLVPGRHYLRADTDEEQALAIVRLLRDPDLAGALAREGRKEALRYDWAALGARFALLARRAAQKQST